MMEPRSYNYTGVSPSAEKNINKIGHRIHHGNIIVHHHLTGSHDLTGSQLCGECVATNVSYYPIMERGYLLMLILIFAITHSCYFLFIVSV